VYFFNILTFYHEIIKRLCIYRVIMLLIRGVSFITVLSTAAATEYPGGCRLSVRQAAFLGAAIRERLHKSGPKSLL